MSCPIDVWTVTVASLGGRSTSPRAGRSEAYARRSIESAGRPLVRILDRPTPHPLIVSWCEAGSGRYGYQIWRAIIARKAGTCVPSRWHIKVGDAVYKPRVAGQHFGWGKTIGRIRQTVYRGIKRVDQHSELTRLRAI